MSKKSTLDSASKTSLYAQIVSQNNADSLYQAWNSDTSASYRRRKGILPARPMESTPQRPSAKTPIIK